MPPPAAETQSNGCPVDHGQYAAKPAGHPGTPAGMPAAAVPWKMTPAEPQSLVCNSAALAVAPQLPRMSGGSCPIDHTQFKAAGAAAAAAAAAHSGSGGVGVVGDQFPDATPGPQQRMRLSTTPVASTIPRGGLAPPGQPPLAPDATWIFPSPQRFYNAMAKKGWDPHEPDMAWVVSIHNTVNEQTWREVLAYERLHAHSCPTPKLSRFRGRPADLSPKARLRGWFGAVAPFDRHDWVVDRCGKEVTYVIDFYQGPQVFMPEQAAASAAAGAGAAAAAPIVGAPPSIHLDVRPALTIGGAMDRIRMQWKNLFTV